MGLGSFGLYECEILFIGIGMQDPYIPDDIPGIDMAIGYESMTLNEDEYKYKNVLNFLFILSFFSLLRFF